MRIRRLSRAISLAAAATLVTAAVAFWAPAASAGGPTSVLLVAPAEETSASLYVSQPRYQQLESLLGVGSQPTAGTRPAALGSYVVVTWLIHDVQVWRVDHIYMGATGGPWIATEEVGDRGPTSAGPVVPESAVWHKATNPAALGTLLKALKLTDTTKASPAPAVPEPAPAAAPAAAKVAAPVAAAKDPGFGAGWWWALPGLLLGALVTAAGLRFRQRTPRVREQELLDRT